MFTINRTYEVFTVESAENGEAADNGFLTEGERVTFRELLDMIQGGEASCYPVRYCEPRPPWITIDCGQDMHTGEYRTESIHYVSGGAKWWYRALRAAGYMAR